MPYTKQDIQATTESQIPQLADDIVKGIVDEKFAMQYIFKKLLPNLQTEVKKRREDEDIWNEALVSQTIEAFQKYLDIYNDDELEYVGRHIMEAKSLKRLIQQDDEEWAVARKANKAEAYKHYLSLYEQSGPIYRGKYVSKAHDALVALQDDEDWIKASETDTIQAYEEYLRLYNSKNSSVKGAHVVQAQARIQEILDDTDWQHASNVNTIDSYTAYIDKYSSLQGYAGKHINEAKTAIKALTPPPPEDPRIKDEEAWIKATRLNSIEGYDEYLRIYDASDSSYKGLHVKEAEMAKRALWDESEWNKAKQSKSINGFKKYLSFCDRNSYPGYVWSHYNAAKAQIGNLEKQEERRRKQEEKRAEEERLRLLREKDNSAWTKACQQNTVKSYNEYLSSQPTGTYTKEANDKIRFLREQSAWQSACAYDTVDAYERYIQSYGNPVVNPPHIEEAKKRIAKLTPKPRPIPNPKPKIPIKWLFGIIAILGLGWLCIMMMNGWSWPYKIDDIAYIFKGRPQQSLEDINEFDPIEIDSLQWAIDNNDIPLLTKYVRLDSLRAYLPLAENLNRIDSIGNLYKTLNLLELSNDSAAIILAQSIVTAIQHKFYSSFENRYLKVNPNSQAAEKEYLKLYKEYVKHNIWLTELNFPRIEDYKLLVIRGTNINELADDFIQSRSKHDVLQTNDYLEWKAQKKAWSDSKKLDVNQLRQNLLNQL